jgi:hypothetical protein
MTKVPRPTSRKKAIAPPKVSEPPPSSALEVDPEWVTLHTHPPPHATKNATIPVEAEWLEEVPKPPPVPKLKAKR